MQQRIGLDQQTLKALAAETRVKMLKLLDKKPLTQSDLASELKMSLPTIGEHLQALAHADLVEREETTRKWKYYSLTQKARILLHPNTTTIWFVLGLFLFSAAATFLSAINYFTSPVFERQMVVAKAEAIMQAAPTIADAAVVAPSPTLLITFGITMIVLLVVLITLLQRHGWLGKSLSNKKNI